MQATEPLAGAVVCVSLRHHFAAPLSPAIATVIATSFVTTAEPDVKSLNTNEAIVESSVGLELRRSFRFSSRYPQLVTAKGANATEIGNRRALKDAPKSPKFSKNVQSFAMKTHRNS
ncbi:MAG: hypothetical protein COT74_11595 [Bdellovibrionales bacterium CG10_big_fil_rev_8_21_14_0_10_45_34]|nr:MAG: hypothetical protein COT74_11595 [Bdellovibrionales bacterium CG10_big_fil_rev_8_21_14_0_10_45_34]